jgi:hypothetical protein
MAGLVRGSVSQYSAGGRSACTVNAVEFMFQLCSSGCEPSAVTPSLIDAAVFEGVRVYDANREILCSTGEEHTNAAEVVMFVDKYSSFGMQLLDEGCSGVFPIVGLSAHMETVFTFALTCGGPGAVVFLTTRGETVAVAVWSTGSSGVFDSHGLPFEAEKVAYFMPCDSHSSVVAFLQDRFPVDPELARDPEVQ